MKMQATSSILANILILYKMFSFDILRLTAFFVGLLQIFGINSYEWQYCDSIISSRVEVVMGKWFQREKEAKASPTHFVDEPNQE